MFARACLAALLAMVCATALAAEPSKAELKALQLRKALHVPAGASLSFLDEFDSNISADDFFKQMEAGTRFDVSKENNGNTVARLSGDAAPKRPSRRPYKVQVGEAFPDFALTSLGGQATTQATLAGRPTLLSFYFSTCPPCIREVPRLNALQTRFPKVRFLAVTFDSRAESAEFVAATQLAWPILPGARSLLDRLGVSTFPSFALVGADGKLVAIGTESELAEKGFDQFLSQIMAGGN